MLTTHTCVSRPLYHACMCFPALGEKHMNVFPGLNGLRTGAEARTDRDEVEVCCLTPGLKTVYMPVYKVLNIAIAYERACFRLFIAGRRPSTDDVSSCCDKLSEAQPRVCYCYYTSGLQHLLKSLKWLIIQCNIQK